jgi:ABC-type Fe3+-siderophore transport system permease subunit
VRTRIVIAGVTAFLLGGAAASPGEDVTAGGRVILAGAAIALVLAAYTAYLLQKANRNRARQVMWTGLGIHALTVAAALFALPGGRLIAVYAAALATLIVLLQYIGLRRRLRALDSMASHRVDG